MENVLLVLAAVLSLKKLPLFRIDILTFVSGAELEVWCMTFETLLFGRSVKLTLAMGMLVPMMIGALTAPL